MRMSLPFPAAALVIFLIVPFSRSSAEENNPERISKDQDMIDYSTYQDCLRTATNQSPTADLLIRHEMIVHVTVSADQCIQGLDRDLMIVLQKAHDGSLKLTSTTGFPYPDTKDQKNKQLQNTLIASGTPYSDKCNLIRVKRIEIDNSATEALRQIAAQLEKIRIAPAIHGDIWLHPTSYTIAIYTLTSESKFSFMAPPYAQSPNDSIERNALDIWSQHLLSALGQECDGQKQPR